MGDNRAGKHPRQTDYQEDATTDFQTLATWEDRWRDSNWATPTGRGDGVVVLDLDNADALDWAEGHGLPRTPMVQTRRGRHIYFAYPTDMAVRNSNKDGIDIRGDGGYVVLPGSHHVTGHVYQHVPGRDFDVPLAPMPTWLRELVSSRADGHRAPSTTVSTSGFIGSSSILVGQRNDQLYRIACRLRRYGCTAGQIESVMQELNVERCVEPLLADEVAALSASAGSAASDDVQDGELIRLLAWVADLYQPADLGDGAFACLVDGHLHRAFLDNALQYTVGSRQLAMHVNADRRAIDRANDQLVDRGLIHVVERDVKGTTWQADAAAIIESLAIPDLPGASSVSLLGADILAHAIVGVGSYYLPTTSGYLYVPFLRFLGDLGVDRRVFKAVAFQGSVTVADIVQRTGAPTSTVQRHRKRLTDLGLVEKLAGHRYQASADPQTTFATAEEVTGVGERRRRREAEYAQQVHEFCLARRRYARAHSPIPVTTRTELRAVIRRS